MAIAGAAIAAGASLLGGHMAGNQAASQARMQMRFAKNAIQWKTEDALKAGIHPLFALGAPTTSFQPVSVGDNGIAAAGQHIGRAVEQTMAPQVKASALPAQIAAVQLEGAKLDNDIKRTTIASELARIRQPGSTPGVPDQNTIWAMDGQGNTPTTDGSTVKIQTRRDAWDPNSPAYVAGAGPSVALGRNPQGGYTPFIPPELAESLEQDRLGQLDWMIRNRILPNLGYGTPPVIPGAASDYTYWDHLNQDWRKRRGEFSFRNNPYRR